MRNDDDELGRKVVKAIESTWKANEAAKEDRVIQTFKVEDEKLNEEVEVQRSWRSSKALNESEEADRDTKLHQGTK